MQNRHVDSESARLRALRDYTILDTLSEKDYDDIVTMASMICDVPIAIVSFVDNKRQWHKASLGMDTGEIPREHSFCSHAIENPGKAFVVPDARKDERFRYNPLVTGDPNVVFYAGIPLVNNEGFGLGTVCVMDNKPRVLNENQLKALAILSDQVMNLLELHRINTELNILNSSLSISRARLQSENTDLDLIGRGLQMTLDKHISERVREIAVQNVELDKMNKELQAFAYISSHDLQEPLRKIQTFSSFISEREFGNLSEKGKEYFEKINVAAERMSVLIKDLLAYSRTTASLQVFEKKKLSQIVKDVLYDLNEEIKLQKASIRLVSDSEIDVMPFQFRQVIYNLLSNAIKFHKPDVAPKIELVGENGTGEDFGFDGLDPLRRYSRISVRDNGIGFDNQYSEKIFELFQRLESREIKMGTGIGLAIVKKVIDNHNGFVMATSIKDEGTTFDLYVPVRPGK